MRPNRSFPNRTGRWALLLLAPLLLLAGCAGRTVTVEIPPRVGLRTWPLIGVVEFSAGTRPELAAAATKQFLIDLQNAQPGLRLLELGSTQAVLREVNRGHLDPDAIKAIGARFGVDAVLTGSLETTEVPPDISFSPDLKSLHAQVSVKGELFAKLQETATGATVWSSGAHGSRTVARRTSASTTSGIPRPRKATTICCAT
jgi:hypothetical protein